MKQRIAKIPIVGSAVRSAVKTCRRMIYSRDIRKRLAKATVRKIVVGASSTFDSGWIPTEIEALNILKTEDWARFFQPDSIDAILAEHVWEHLTAEEGLLGARLCYRYLKPGGYLRLAVPDGMNPDPEYIDWVRVGGRGAGASDHKVLYTYRTLEEILEKAGFRVALLEYFDESGKFRCADWSPADGTIRRSKRFDKRNRAGPLKYTSLIADAFKEIRV